MTDNGTSLNDRNYVYRLMNKVWAYGYEERLKAICKRDINKIRIVYLNINSLRNKFDDLKKQITGDVDILEILQKRFTMSFQ